MVPASIRSAGSLVIGTNVPYQPMEYFASNGTTFTGADIDLITAIASGLNLKPQIKNMDWDGLIPALDSGRLDAAIASIGDFSDRQTHANFVNYLNDSAEVEVLKSNASKYKTLLDLCGGNLAVESGTGEIVDAQYLNKQCTKAGKSPMKILTFGTASSALLAVQSGRADFYANDSPVAENQAATVDGGNQIAAILPSFQQQTIQYGIATAKTAPGLQLAKAMNAELNALMKNGTYAKILAKYHITNLALKVATVNGAKISSTSLK